ncbi:MAG: hypothetical protein ACOYD7_04345 [Raoultibacter sp.]|jgi:hypothetical protein
MADFIQTHTGWFIFGIVIVVAAIAVVILLKYMFRYKLTDDDCATPLPGDDYLDAARESVLDGGGVAITINAPAELVWQHMRQFGQDRAGWYSFEKLERIFTFDIHNHYTIHEEWQDFGPGRYLFYHQPPWGVGSVVTEVDEERHAFASVSDSRKEPPVEGSICFVPPFKLKYFCWTWNFGAIKIDDNTTRLITKAQVSFEPFTKVRKALVAVTLGTASYVMLSHMMNLLKRICEGTKTIDEKHR